MRISDWSSDVCSSDLLAACGGSSSAPSPTEEDAGTSPAAAPDEATTAASSPLVGLWMQVHTCEQLVTGLEEAGLGEIAPAVVGDFFPDQTAEEIGRQAWRDRVWRYV